MLLRPPGERCSVDGTVIDGRSETDQSLITGAALRASGACDRAPRAGSGLGTIFVSRVLLNSGDVIERLTEVDHLILNKIGTLTPPDLDVTNAADIPAGVFALAGRLALSSHHPVAAAIVPAAGLKPPIIGMDEEAGQGVRVMVDGADLGLCARQWVPKGQ
ncbi:cation transport ATPase [Bradyrhizobium sp. JR1.5]